MKSAIEQMVEWLKKRRAKVFVWNDNYVERQSVLRKAQELQAEEQAHKPEAPAGPVKDNLESWEDEAKAFYEATGYLRPGKDPGIIGDTDYRERRDREWKTWCAGYGYCASRYHPAPRRRTRHDQERGDTAEGGGDAGKN